MSSKKTLLKEPLSAEMGESVVRYLKELYPDLPNQGYLAGQSVTSALLAIYGVDQEKKGPVNDLDVFVSDSDIFESILATSKMNLAHKNPLDKMLDEISDPDGPKETGQVEVRDAYDGPFLTSSRGIVNVEKIGLLNLIQMGKIHSLDSLLKSFDFNLVSVGIDLESNRMEWIPHFESFIENGKAELIRNADLRSLVRALKKADEMPWIDMEIKPIALKIFINDLSNEINDVSAKIHPATKALLDKFDPNHEYPREEDYRFNSNLGMVYPVTLSIGNRKNTFGLPTEQNLSDFINACRYTGDVNVVRELVKDGFPVDMPLSSTAQNEYVDRGIDFAMRYDQSDLFDFFKKSGQVMYFVRNNHDLHNAAALGAVKIIGRLIEQGTPVDINTNSDHKTPLSLAAKHGEDAACAVLINSGANIDGLTLNEFNKLERECADIPPPLHEAISALKSSTVSLLISSGADVNVKCHFSGNTALHVLAQTNEINDPVESNLITQSLIASKVNLNELNNQGETALYIATATMREYAQKSLLKNGADFRGGANKSPLRHAARRARKLQCLILLAYGCKSNASISNQVGAEISEFLSDRNDRISETRQILDYPQIYAAISLNDGSVLLDILEKKLVRNIDDYPMKELQAWASDSGYEQSVIALRAWAAKEEMKKVMRELNLPGVHHS